MTVCISMTHCHGHGLGLACFARSQQKKKCVRALVRTRNSRLIREHLRHHANTDYKYSNTLKFI